jgi:Leucine-rich repeat (LRR) protein
MSLHLSFRNSDEIDSSEVQNPDSIEQVYIKFCDLEVFPQLTFKLCNLTHLSIASNNISFVPKEIQNLAHLTYLDVSSNNISSLVEDLFKLSKIEYFDASYNYITQIPGGRIDEF